MLKSTAVALGALLAVTITNTAMAETQWERSHPRRDEVNDRLATQNARIHDQVKEGELTKGQAAKLHRDDRKIRRGERLMASQNGGHVTKLEQRALNQQENRASRKIGE